MMHFFFTISSPCYIAHCKLCQFVNLLLCLHGMAVLVSRTAVLVRALYTVLLFKYIQFVFVQSTL